MSAPITPLPEPNDPKGLIRESYAMDPIGDAECRSILIDWALSLPLGSDMPSATRALLAQYGAARPDHPMTLLLQAALNPATRARRQGGRAARLPR